MTESIWGKDQLGFFLDGTVSDKVGSRVAEGIVNYSTNPSTVWVFGYQGRIQAVKNLIGEHGVTNESKVFDNTTREYLGTAGEFTQPVKVSIQVEEPDHISSEYKVLVADRPMPANINGCPMGRGLTLEAAKEDLIYRIKLESHIDITI